MGEGERVAVVCMPLVSSRGGDECERTEIYMMLGQSARLLWIPWMFGFSAVWGGTEMFGWFFCKGQESMRRLRVRTHRVGLSSRYDYVGVSSTCFTCRDICIKCSKR